MVKGVGQKEASLQGPLTCSSTLCVSLRCQLWVSRLRRVSSFDIKNEERGSRHRELSNRGITLIVEPFCNLPTVRSGSNAPGKAKATLAHIMYLSISFRKSTPLQNRQLMVNIRLVVLLIKILS